MQEIWEARQAHRPPDAPAHQVPSGFREVHGEAFMETVGPIYARQGQDGRWEIGCLALPRHANRFGAVHGGMLATLVDYAVGFNLLDEDDPSMRLGTVSLNIDFISGGQVGEWLQVQVRIDKDHGRLRFCSCSMQGGSGRLILRASGVFSSNTKIDSC